MVCAPCRYCRRRCCGAKLGAARTIRSNGQEPLPWPMSERMRQPESRALYARRKAIVEPMFGQIGLLGMADDPTRSWGCRIEHGERLAPQGVETILTGGVIW